MSTKVTPTQLSVQIVGRPAEAPDYKNAEIALYVNTAIVVKNGTLSGKCTVDLQFMDQHGEKYVAMLTGRTIEGLAQVIAANQPSDTPATVVQPMPTEGGEAI